MHRRRLLATLTAACLPATLLLTASPATAVDYDCSDWRYQEDAQAVYDLYGASDPYELDPDGDGVACESLPHRPTEWPAHPPFATPPLPSETYGHDFDGDGNADLLAVDPAGKLFLYPGTGDGRFGARSQIGHGWNTRDMIMHAGDWDGDGYRDVIARDPSDGTLWLYRGNGRGGFRGSVVIGRGWNVFSTIVAPGDADGDRDPDLLGVHEDGSMYLYRGNGRGGFSGPYPKIGHGWDTRDAITAVGDWDRDGDNDLIAREPATGDLWLYAGSGIGTFTGGSTRGVGWGHFTALVGPGDWDGNGYIDVLARTPDGDLYRYSPDSRRKFAPPYPKVGHGWAGFTLVGSSVS